MALFKILKGNEANLPSTKHEGWAYVTEKGNMYVDLSNDKRVKIGNRADTAEYADKATGDTQTIRSRYLARIKQVTSDGTQFTFRGETGDGTNAPDLISIPLAGDKAGLVSNAAQTIKGEKTFANGIKFPDVTSTTYPAVSAGLTWSGSTDGAKIYYEVQASDKGMLIIEARDDTNAGAIFRNSNSKKEVSIINGLVTGAFKGNLTGTASHATSDANGKNIASYVASVLAQSDNRTIRVTKGDGTTNDVKLYFAASSSFGGAADSANVLNINNTENIGVGRMQFFQKSGDATLMPDTNWWSLVRLQHGGYASTGYWTEMAYAFHSDTIKFRRNQNGTKSAWKTIAFTDGTIAKATQAEKDWLGQVIDETYMKYPLSISGEVITMTRGDGVSSTITVPDTKVTQSETTTSNYRPIILGYTNTTDTTKLSASTRNQVYASNKFYAQPSTGTLVATTFKGALDGNAKTATNAEFAEKAKGDTQSIQSKYVSSVLKKSGSNYVLRITKGDGTYNDVDLYFAGSSSCGGPANSANVLRTQGRNNNLLIPSANAGTSGAGGLVPNAGMTMYEYYAATATGAPTNYGNLITVKGNTPGATQIALPWGGTTNTAPYIRTHSDWSTEHTWSEWKQLVYTDGTVQNSQYAEKDKDGNIISATYIATLKQVTSNGTTFTFRGVSGNGTDRPNLITIPAATTSKAGLVTTVAQTWAGNKTFTGDIIIAHDCVNTMTNTSTNPQLKLGNADLSQYAIMMYTSYDSYRAPGGIKVLGPSPTDPIWFEVEGDLYVGRNLYDKEKNILLASKYIASITGSQGDTNYTITPKNQEGTTLSSVLNVPINLVSSGNTSSKIFLVGTTSQNAKAQTGYSHDTVFIDSDGFLYDSGNKPSYHSKVSVGNTNNYKYHRIARTNEITSSWHDGTILLYISQDYNGGSYGLLRVSLRTNNISSTASASLEGEWITRSGFALNNFKLALYSAANKVYADLYYVSPGTYAGITVKQIQQGSRGSLNQSRWFLTNSSEVNDTTTSDKKTSTSYKDITAAQAGLRGGVAYTLVADTTDASRVNNANYADRAQYDWNGNDIRKKYIATLAVKTTNGTTFTFKGSSMEGDELSAITVPVATASVAGLVTNGAQTWAGNKTLNNDLYIKGKVAISASSINNYNFYVNGTSYFNGNTIIKGHLTPDSDSAYDIGSTSKHWRYGYYDGMFISADTGFTATAGNQGKAGTYVGPGYFEMTASTPYIDFHNANSTSDFSARIISDGANRLSIKQGGTPVALSYNSRSISPLLQVNGILYSSQAIESAEYFLNNRASAGGGFYVYGNAKQYARIHINTIGAAGDETNNGTTGVAMLTLGNSTAVAASGGANNARGLIRIYGANANYTNIYAQANGNRTLYLPNYTGTMYLVHAGNNNAIGNATTPVYIAANGRVTACTSYTAALDGRYVNVTGDTMTGTLHLQFPYQATAGSRYHTSAIEIREAGNVGSGQSDIGYAPRIGFHWANRVAASLVLHSNGAFYFRNQADTGNAPVYASTFYGALSGNASSATYSNYVSNPRNSNTNMNTWNYGAGTMYFREDSGSTVSNLPSSAWWQTMCQHSPDANYGNQLAQQMTGGTSAYIRSFQSGTWSSWYRLWRQGDAVTSAVWNDYAECRKSDSQEPGYVMFEKGDDTLSKTIERLQHFAGIVSDTWGFSQGETADAKTNIAVAGRVLAYPYRDRNEYKPGDCVCAAPGGKVDIMTREEIVQYPDRIVGTVSCVPEYEEWGGGEGADRDPVKVNGRIWIKVK